MSAILSFLGGTAFRWIFGEVVGFLKAQQEHAQELAMLQLQHEQDRDKTQWRIAEYKAAADAGVQIIEAKSEASRQEFSDKMFLAAVQGVNDLSKEAGKVVEKGGFNGWLAGFSIALNSFIRPELAQVSIFLLAGSAVFPAHIVLQGAVLEVVCTVLGVFVGGRIVSKG